MNRVDGSEKCFLLTALLSCLFISCSPTENDQVFEEDSMEEILLPQYSDMELEILSLVNIYRDSRGLPECKKLDPISIQARLHNEHMILLRELCHHNFGERYRILTQQLGAKSMGENIGYGYSSADALVKGWIKSKDHRKILEGKSGYFGVSAREGEEHNIYVTLIFVRR